MFPVCSMFFCIAAMRWTHTGLGLFRFCSRFVLFMIRTLSMFDPNSFNNAKASALNTLSTREM
jgi:hypothetical protein